MLLSKDKKKDLMWLNQFKYHLCEETLNLKLFYLVTINKENCKGLVGINTKAINKTLNNRKKIVMNTILVIFTYLTRLITE